MSEQNRKIKLPDYCCPFNPKFSGGDKNCQHDFPPEFSDEDERTAWWVCSKCNMRVTYEVYD